MRLTSLLIAAATVALAACGGTATKTADSNMAAADSNAAASAPAAPAKADFSPATGDQVKTVMHDRHEGMEQIGKASKALRRELDGSGPDMATVRSSAATIADLAGKSSGWFRAGTGPDAGKTGAKPEIWQNQADFAAKLQAFQVAAAALSNSTAGNDVNAVKNRFADLGNSCKACHDKYRAEMKH